MSTNTDANASFKLKRSTHLISLAIFEDTQIGLM